MTARNLAGVALVLTALATLTLAIAEPAWDPIHLVGLAAVALLATGLLSRGGQS